MHGDLVQLFNLAAMFTVQQPLATSSEMRTQENLPSLYFQFGISIVYYTINQVILAFWLVLVYDLLEDIHTIDIITTKFLILHFKMAESLEK